MELDVHIFYLAVNKIIEETKHSFSQAMEKKIWNSLTKKIYS